MNLENRMSIGYQKGKFWVPDHRYSVYSERPAYKALLRATTKAGFGTNVEYSYTAQRYMAEIITIERFEKSQQTYMLKHNNSFHANPMAALSMAIRNSGRATPLVLACCLEIECELLREAQVLAVAQEREHTRLMDRLEGTIYDLGVCLAKLTGQMVITDIAGRFGESYPDEDDDL